MKGKMWILLAMVLALVGAVATGCKPEETPPTAGEEAGEYYCDAEGKEYTLTLGGACEYTLVMDRRMEGTYTPSGEQLILSLEEGELTATYFEDAVTLEFEGKSYRFLRTIDYTVTFETGEGSKVSAQSVRNGRTANKPVDPTKTGEVFVGWYTDSAFKSMYTFEEPVTSELKLYARFVAPINPEFTVTFDLMGGTGEIEAKETVGHKAFGLPTPEWEGHEFVGWWVSQYGDGEKLTYRYAEQELEEDTTLYAVWADGTPAVSVEEGKIVWTAQGTNSRYEIVIKNLTTEEEKKATVGQTEYSYNFAQEDEGEYEISVTVNGKTGKAYYRNKGLSRVTVFRVEGNTLLFNGVENAEKYIIAIECGNEAHDHANGVEVGAGDEDRRYDFTMCDMKDGAITFRVTAMATGYLSSTSEEYKVTRTLGQTTANVDPDTETLSWTEVENATSYDVEIKQGGKTVYAGNVTEGNTLALKNYDKGMLEITVTPKARGWNSPEATNCSYDKLTLATPGNIRLDNKNSKIVWDAVSGASEYEVKIGDVTKKVTTNEIEFDESYYIEGKAEYPVTIRALGEKEEENSQWTDTLNVRYGAMGGDLRYENRRVTWDPVFGVNKFIVEVDGVQTEYEDVNSAEVVFTRKGEIKISVYAEYEDGKRSEPISTTVTVYELSFDTQGGDENIPSIFVVKGDTLDLPEAARTGYTSKGWFTASEEGERYDDRVYADENDRTVYAQWTANQYLITFDLGAYGNTEAMTEELRQGVYVTYGQGYDLPVPEANDLSYGFRGWYTADGEGGIQYTDYNGVSRDNYTQAEGMKLYAHWVQIFSFTAQRNGQGAIVAYQVSKTINTQTSGIKKLRIPAEYNGAPVTTVVDFTNLTQIEEISIPDSIRLISIASSESAFSGCTSLKDVKIYETDYNDHKFYSDDNGVLLYHNMITGDVQLKYYPAGRSDTQYTVPSGVQTLPSGIFYRTKLTEIIIPANVTLIETEAINLTSSYGNNLTKITFLAAEEGAEELPLMLRPGAFTNVTKLVDLQLPARATDFSFAEVFTEARSLKNITVVGTGGKYTAVEGLLCRDLGAEGIELAYWPQGRTGEFTLPKGILSIGEGALKGNKDLTKIVIPETLEKIGNNAFEDCINVESIEFRGTAQSRPLAIGEGAFQRCSSKQLTEIVLPENLVSLGSKAFIGTGITKVTVNSGALGELDFAAQAFSGVVELILGPDVKDISFSEVFGSSLKSVNAENNKYYRTDEQGVLYNQDMSIIAFYPDAREGLYKLPTTVKTLPANVFNAKKNMTEIELHNELTEIGASAFYMSGLQKITIPNSVSSIEANAFASTPLATIEFTSGNTENELRIGASAFESCNSLTKVEFPERLVSLGKQLFQSCANIETVSFPATLETIEKFADTNGLYPNRLGMFNFASKKLTKLIVAEGNTHYGSSESGDLYLKKQNENGEYYLSELMYHPANGGKEVFLESTTERIWSEAFNDINYTADTAPVNAVTTISFKDNTAHDLILETHAFYKLKNLTTINLPHGTSVIRYQTFDTLSSLKTIKIPNTVTSIEAQAFNIVGNLTTIEFEEGNLETPLRIEGGTPKAGYTGAWDRENTFGTSTNLTVLNLPERTSYIGPAAFKGSKFKTVTIPSTVTTIDDGAFYSVTTITSLTFTLKGTDGAQGKLIEIGDQAFYNCTSIASDLKFPASLQTIGIDAFYNCTAIKLIAFEDNSQLVSLGELGKRGPFYNCKAITSVDFGANSSLQFIYDQTFSGTSATNAPQMETIKIPASIEMISVSVFYNCGKLATVEFETKDGKSNLKEIRQSAFGNSGLTSFSFPESVSEITLGSGIFTNCSKLKDVHISSKITSIDGLFSGVTSIENVTVASDSEYLMASGDKTPIIYNKKDYTIFYIVGLLEGDIELDERVTHIGSYAFSGQTKINKVIIPAKVETISSFAFNGCTSLKEIEFKSGSALRELGAAAFTGCKLLEKINFEATVNLTTISGNNVFQNCTALLKLDFSKTQLQNFCNVSGCTSLKEIYFPKTLESFSCGGVNTTSTFSKTAIQSIDLSETKITSLPTSMFNGCEKLVSVKLPKTVTECGLTVFTGCIMLQEIDLSTTSLTEIKGPTSTSGDGAFTKCTKLKTVTLPGTLQIIGNIAFKGLTNLTTINLASVTGFGSNVFEGCTSLSEVDLSGATDIGASAFKNCGFTKLTVPVSVTKWGGSSFNGNKKLKEVVFPAQLNAGSTLGANMFQDCTILDTLTVMEGCSLTELPASCFFNTAFTSITNLPASITKIGDYAFKNCLKLNSFDIKNTQAQSLGANIFEGCTLLSSVELPDTITSFGSNTFLKCSALESIKLPASLTALPATCFSSCSSLATIEGLEHITEFGTSCLSGVAITSVTLKNGISYPKGLFKNCEKLTTINFGDITELAESMFEDCDLLANIVIPDTVTSLGKAVFKNCKALTTVKLPMMLTEIGESAFEGCVLLKDINLYELVLLETLPKNLFKDCSELAVVSLPATLKELGEGSFQNTGVTAVDLKAYPMESLPASVFAGCTKLVTVELPIGLTEIGKSAFDGCELIESIVLPEGITALPASAFANCAALTQINLGKITDIGEKAFQNCVSLAQVDLSSLIKASNYAFSNTGFTTFTVPATVERLGSYFFKDCALLQTVVFKCGPFTPYTSTSGVPNYLFQNCVMLSTIQLPEGLTEIGTYWFNGCTALTSYTIPETVTSIGANAFENSGVTSLVIPKDVTVIGNNCFKGSKLQKITFNNGNFNTTKTGSTKPTYLFQNCTELTEVHLPEGITTFGNNWFDGCSALKELEIPITCTAAPNSNVFKNASIETLIFREGTTYVGANYDTNLKESSFKSLKRVVIPKSVTKIDVKSFPNLTENQEICFVGTEQEVKASFEGGETGFETFRKSVKAKISFAYKLNAGSSTVSD